MFYPVVHGEIRDTVTFSVFSKDIFSWHQKTPVHLQIISRGATSVRQVWA